ncbi:transcription termination factor Rho, partial [Staphylococcus pseudintermedius]
KEIDTIKTYADLLILLIGERPEEFIDDEGSVDDVEVVHSAFDEQPEHLVEVDELLLEREKRVVEIGEDVIILMALLTRLVRAYNIVVPPSRRILSSGVG